MPKLYDLGTQSVGTFMEKDPKIPPFQRKSTWGPEHRFRLALSVFKEYPLGTVVVKESEKVESGIAVPVLYLIDGRQRFETFRAMANPESVWMWAKKVLGLTATSTNAQLIEKFRRYVNRYYFGQEDWEQTPTNEAEMLAAPAQEEASDAVDDQDSDVATDELPEEHASLNGLVQLLLLTHPVDEVNRTSGLRRIFDFTETHPGLPYAATDDSGAKYVGTDGLLDWLTLRTQGKDIEQLQQQEFLSWLQPPDESAETLAQDLEARWPQIVQALVMVRLLRQKVRGSTLGYLEIRPQSAPDDDKKIFEIINTAGAKLTAAEMLSAKVTWNATPDVPGPVVDNVRSLYSALDVSSFDGKPRKWDIAATLLDRLEAPLVLEPNAAWSWDGITVKRFERKVSLGFRILSGHYQNKLMKSDIEKLAMVPEVQWNSLALEKKMSQAFASIASHWFFRYLSAWDFFMSRDMSDYVAANYLLVMTKDWERKSAPSGGDARKQFHHNALVLFDRSVYEYLDEQWRGSGDSKIERSLARLVGADSPPLFPRVTKEDWIALTDSVLAGSIGDKKYTGKLDVRLRPLLAYMMALLKVMPAEPGAMEIDHIIPRSVFRTVTDPTLSDTQHHVANLALLGGSANAAKREHRLSELTDPVVIEEVERASRVPRSRFAEFSVLEGVPTLRHDRSKLIRDAMTVRRESLLNDPEAYKTANLPALWV